MMTSPSGQGVIIIGGTTNHIPSWGASVFSNTMLELTGSMQWTILEQNLDLRKHFVCDQTECCDDGIIMHHYAGQYLRDSQNRVQPFLNVVWCYCLPTLIPIPDDLIYEKPNDAGAGGLTVFRWIKCRILNDI